MSLTSLSFFNSHLFTVSTAFALSGVCAGLLLHAHIPPILAGAAIGTMAIALIILLRKVSKNLIYEISLIYTTQTSKAWWNGITENIILGAIPLEHQKEKIKATGVTHVISAVENFELQRGIIYPMNQALWQGIGIQHKHIDAEDFKGVSPEKIHEGVEFIHQEIQNNPLTKIYIHCKAGRGRSATIVVAYLWKYSGFDTKEKAYAFVKSIRPRIKLNAVQMGAIQQYIDQFPK